MGIWWHIGWDICNQMADGRKDKLEFPCWNEEQRGLEPVCPWGQQNPGEADGILCPLLLFSPFFSLFFPLPPFSSLL
jgi:hypothetical protein